ncbi:MAG: tetratricopeptide repeat protein [Flavobacteriales bacterium]|jgi:tetratricopeptide (TPR) repeat protein|nr:tetratricopeptide repeat protein [Flavobacteriales bacterium]MCB0758582.1 tetratricopeptide repeat protein [Flavobacteriales bacterium]
MKLAPRRNLLVIITMILCLASYAQDGKTFLKDAEKLRASGQLDAALEQYGFAIRVDSNYVKALLGRASLYLDMGRMEERMADMEHVARLTPRDAGNLTMTAVACLDAHDPAKARRYADAALAISSKSMEAMQTKVRACLALGDVRAAVEAADAALALKGTTDTYYLHARSRMASGDFTTADADLDKVLEWNPLYEAAYVASGETQLQLYTTYRGVSMQMRALEKAINRCTRGLELNPSSTELLIVRSKAYALQKEFSKAIDDVSKCVALGREDSVVFYQRALYYHGFGQEQNAVNDLNRLLLQSPDNVRFLLLRAECREANLDLDGAARDLGQAEKQMKDHPAEWTAEDLKAITVSKERVQMLVFEMNREADPPVITVVEPLRKDDVVQVSSALTKVKVAGHVRDKSLLKSIKVQNVNADFDPEDQSPEFRATVPLAPGDKEIDVMAEDVYGNRSTITLHVQRTEGDPPSLMVTVPSVSADRVAVIPAGKDQLFVEGRASDPSGIRSVMVDGRFASFIPDTSTTDFSIKLEIAGRDQFTVRAEDRYGNVTENTYAVHRAAPVVATVKPVPEKPASPMGTAWVIYIENSNYRNMPALNSLGMDKMRKAFSKYQAQRTIVKKNLTKTEFERFFNIELRDLVRSGQVNTLLVWYEGHGRSQGGKAYWIPVDGKADDIYSFYNYGPLKGLMENYSESVRTTLVVSDAAGNDPSFYELTR